MSTKVEGILLANCANKIPFGSSGFLNFVPEQKKSTSEM